MAHPRDSGLQAALWMGLRGLVPLVVLGAAGVGLLVFVQPPGDEGGEVPRAAKVAAPVLLPVAPPPAEPVPAAMPARAWARDLGFGPRPVLRLPDAVPPQALCSALAEAGWAMSGWAPSQLDPTVHECIGERPLGAGGAKARGSAFVILRGRADGDLSDVRIRLNVLEPATAGEASDIADGALRLLFDRLRWSLPADVVDAVAARRELRTELSGTRLRFWRERGEIARYNLSLEMPGTPGPADRFVQRGPETARRPAAGPDAAGVPGATALAN